LRASKSKSDDERYTTGKFVGTEWANDDAEAKELERLSSLHRQIFFEPSLDWKTYFDDSHGLSVYSAAERLYFTLHDEDDGDRDASREFWNSVLEDRVIACDTNVAEFFRGFCDGALEVWDSVKDQL